MIITTDKNTINATGFAIRALQSTLIYAGFFARCMLSNRRHQQVVTARYRRRPHTQTHQHYHLRLPALPAKSSHAATREGAFIKRDTAEKNTPANLNPPPTYPHPYRLDSRPPWQTQRLQYRPNTKSKRIHTPQPAVKSMIGLISWLVVVVTQIITRFNARSQK